MRLVGKFFWCALAILAAVEILSWLALQRQETAATITLLMGAAVLGATLTDLRWGVIAIMAELFIGGKGYLFAIPLGADRLSIRMVVFLIVFSVWLGRKIARQRFSVAPARSKAPPPPAMLLGLTVAVGIVLGLMRYPVQQVFFDANGWLVFLLLPLFLKMLQSSANQQRVVQALAAAVLVMAAKTLLVLYWFGHRDSAQLEPLYRWIRETGVGEITHVSGPLFRVFFQSHVYALVAWLVLLALLMGQRFQRRSDTIAAALVVYVASLTLLASQSRSLWAGGLGGIALLMLMMIRRRVVTLPIAFSVAALLIFILQSQLSAVALISGNYGANVLANRFTALGTEPASASRASQLPPLLAAINQHPLMGSGFGRQLTYHSQDPRVQREHPGGRFTTSAFEWGYLDMALKIGLLGLAAYLWWMGQLLGAAWRSRRPDNVPLAMGVALAAVAITNIFSPYLNHPLGIGLLLLTAATVSGSQAQPAAGKIPAV